MRIKIEVWNASSPDMEGIEGAKVYIHLKSVMSHPPITVTGKTDKQGIFYAFVFLENREYSTLIRVRKYGHKPFEIVTTLPQVKEGSKLIIEDSPVFPVPMTDDWVAMYENKLTELNLDGREPKRWVKKVFIGIAVAFSILVFYMIGRL